MTFNKAAWAIDGAIVNSALARTEAYAANSGQEGIVSQADLKVTQTATPGASVYVRTGAALVLNRYQTTPNQMYTVTNPTYHTVAMPAMSASQQTFIVAVAIGDPEFSQSGHPFMQATDPPVGEESTFEYVRPVVLTEAAFNARAYPALALAKIVRPANTTTITDAMITDLRKLARPRTKLEIVHTAGPGVGNHLNADPGNYERWPNVTVMTVPIPEWAVQAKVIAHLEGIRHQANGAGKIRAQIEGTSLVTPLTNVDESDPATVSDRKHYTVMGEINVKSLAGTTRSFAIYATTNNLASKTFLTTDASTSVGMQVYFEEQPT